MMSTKETMYMNKKTRARVMTMTLLIIATLSSALVLPNATTRSANAQIFPSTPTPPEQQQQLQMFEQLRQSFVELDQGLLQMPPQQQQATILYMQQLTMQGFSQMPPQLIPQAIQILQQAMPPRLAQAVLFPVIAQLQTGGQQPQPPGGSLPTPPQPSTQDQGPTTNPQLNALMRSTDSLLSQLDNKKKDSSWSPPATFQDLNNKCIQQQSDPSIANAHCTDLLNTCNRNRLTVAECYANYFTNGNVPDEVLNSALAKLKAENARLDAALGIQKSMPPPSGFGLMNPDCVGPSC
jgi:hypothetical protein